MLLCYCAIVLLCCCATIVFGYFRGSCLLPHCRPYLTGMHQGERLTYYKEKRQPGSQPLGSISLTYVLSITGTFNSSLCIRRTYISNEPGPTSASCCAELTETQRHHRRVRHSTLPLPSASSICKPSPERHRSDGYTSSAAARSCWRRPTSSF